MSNITRYSLALLIVTITTFGQEAVRPMPQSEASKAIWMKGPAVIAEATPVLVVGSIKLDGKTGEITWDKSITPTEAAKQFAEELKKAWPTMFQCAAKSLERISR